MLFQELIRIVEEKNPQQKEIVCELTELKFINETQLSYLWQAFKGRPDIEKINISLKDDKAYADKEIMLTRQDIEGGKKSFIKKFMQSSVLNPFIWQIESHFDGLLRDVDGFTQEDLAITIDLIGQEVGRLNDEKFFSEFEIGVRRSIKKNLFNHTVQQMAKQLLHIPLEKEEEWKKLYANADMIFLTSSSLWELQCNNKLQLITLLFSYETEVKELYALLKHFLMDVKIIQSRQITFNDDNGLFQQLKEIDNESIDYIYKIGLELTTKYLEDCTQEFKELEKKSPGWFARLLEMLFCANELFYKLEDSVKIKLKKLFDKIINDNNLRCAIEDELVKNLCKAVGKFEYNIHRWIRIERSRLYARKVMKRNPSREELNDLDDLNNLIMLCGSDRALDWLINHKVEYDFEVMEILIDNIDFDAIKIDRALAEYIINLLASCREYKQENLCSDGFIKQSIINCFEKILNDNKFIEKITGKIKASFAYAKTLIQKGEFDELMQLYNKAFVENDYVEMQKLWAVFSRVNYLLKQLDDEISANEQIEKLLEEYTKIQTQQYFRTYPSVETRIIVYPSKKPEKAATLELFPTLAPLIVAGRKVKDIFEQKKDAKSSNIVTAMMVFIVSDKPYDPIQKNRTHKRIFVPVQLVFSKYSKKLLSVSASDGIFSEGAYFTVAYKDHVMACNVIKANTCIDYSSLMVQGDMSSADSERPFLELLKDEFNLLEIVECLKKELLKKFSVGELVGKYMVYSMLLFLYSSNSECDKCTLSLIGLQNSFGENEFLNRLTRILNQTESHFQTKGWHNNKQDFNKFSLTTFVGFDRSLSCQADHLTEGPDIPIRSNKSKPNMHCNPKAKLFFWRNAINLKRVHRVGSFNGSFFEFPLKESSKIDADLKLYCGNVFMSGLKEKKFKKEEIQPVETEVQNLFV